MSIDAFIAEAQASAAAQPQPQETIEDEGTNTETLEPAEGEASETDGKTEAKKDYLEVPKPIANKISRQDRKIGKLTAEKHAMLRELEGFRQKATPEKSQTSELKKPNPDDHKTWGEYLDARDEYNEKRAELIADKKISETQANRAQEKVKETDTELQKEYAQRRLEVADAARKSFADFDKVLDVAFKDVQLAPHIIEALDEADNGALALYAYTKEGLELNDLNELTPAKAAMLIARYEDKGIALTKTKKVTNAPTPMTPNKGTGAGGKPLDQLTHEEAHKMLSTSK